MGVVTPEIRKGRVLSVLTVVVLIHHVTVILYLYTELLLLGGGQQNANLKSILSFLESSSNVAKITWI